jgi:hypothetical protein
MHWQKISGGLAAALLTTAAWAGTPCEGVKNDIAAKLTAKGVKGYTLDIVANDAVKDQKVVGSCEGGTKKIVYSRGGSPPSETPATSP